MRVMTERWGASLLSCYLRRSPWETGRWRVIPKARALCDRALADAGVRTIATRHGFGLSVDLADWLGRIVFATGEYEPPVTALMKALLRPGATVVDAGANIGYFTLLASRLVGKTGHVLAFEPNPSVYQRLLGNLQRNAVTNVTAVNEALSRTAGVLPFYEGPSQHTGISSLRPLEQASVVRQVRCRRLVDVVPAGPPVALVKIDVEGAELDVIDGMTEIIERDSPDIVVEVTDAYLREMSASAVELRDRLTRFGYRGYAIGFDALVPFDDDWDSLPPQFNALFTKKGLADRGLRVHHAWVG
jgi:FkbM family methyltransferase